MCVFCNKINFILENELAGAFYDTSPVNKGHMLIIPKKHKVDYFDLSIEEKIAIDDLLQEGKQLLDEKYQPDAYNLGANCGVDAGQSILHCHIHLIPRYHGDMLDPKGGVRGVIPSKQVY